MKYVDEFRDPVRARALIDSIVPLCLIASQRSARSLAAGHGVLRWSHPHDLSLRYPATVARLYRTGARARLPCLCACRWGRIDDCVTLARDPRVIFTTFGDAMRVPGSRGSLLQAKADGADVRMVYSPLDALKLAKENPDREVVFFRARIRNHHAQYGTDGTAGARSGHRQFLVVLSPHHHGARRSSRYWMQTICRSMVSSHPGMSAWWWARRPFISLPTTTTSRS